ncbi:MAG: ABC transporter ATP-binding protein [Lachnospiraceae bacterium]
MSDKLLEINNLKTTFTTLRGKVTAIDGVSFSVSSGEILGIVGESGCGKSVTSQSVMRLYDEKNLASYEGSVFFEGKDILHLPEKEMEKIRGNDIAMIFQDALSSLDPVFTIGEQISETIRQHQKVSKKQAMEMAVDILKQTGIPAPNERVKAYPHEMSGGMRQRAMIAMALCCKPRLLIADEPTTALDVTIQDQILSLLLDLNKQYNMGVMLITHDLGVVAQVCTRVVIMYLGQIVEEATVNDLFDNPLHPYTQGLISSIPRLDTDKDEPLYIIDGTVPSLSSVKRGCRFAGRCKYATDKCREETVPLVNIDDTHKVRCFKYEEQR